MKRVLSVLFVLLCCLTLSMPSVSAQQIPNVTDMAGVLTTDQQGELSESLFTLQNEYGMTILAVIDEGFYSYDAKSSADDWYDEYGHGYGNGSGDDGILFYVSTLEREYHFSTCGRGISVFNGDAVEHLKQEVEPYLRADDYYGAICAYISVADEVLSLSESGISYEQTDWSYVAVVIGGAVLVTLFIAFVMMNVQLSKMNTAVANDYAANYMKEGSYHLDMARDIFLYSRITKVKKANTNHTSSSGRTHGGGGGKF